MEVQVRAAGRAGHVRTRMSPHSCGSHPGRSPSTCAGCSPRTGSAHAASWLTCSCDRLRPTCPSIRQQEPGRRRRSGPAQQHGARDGRRARCRTRSGARGRLGRGGAWRAVGPPASPGAAGTGRGGQDLPRRSAHRSR
jgi:hypothetical protein